MRLVIIWSNGKKDKIDVTDEFREHFIKTPPYLNENGFEKWSLTFQSDKGIGAFNMKHARAVYLEY